MSQWASLFEAWGVDTLDVSTSKVEKTPFSNQPELVGQDVHSDVIVETIRREPKRIRRCDVKRYIDNAYTSGGLHSVWGLLGNRIKKNIKKHVCSKNDLVSRITSFLDNPDNVLILLAALCIFIIMDAS